MCQHSSSIDWSMRCAQLIISTIALVLNSASIIVGANRPIISLHSAVYTFISGYQLCHLLHIFVTEFYDPCWSVGYVTIASCQLQSAPLLGAYILSALLSILFIADQYHHRCWQPMLIILASIITLTIFIIDDAMTTVDDYPRKCMYLFVFRTPIVAFGLLTGLMTMHSIGAIMAHIHKVSTSMINIVETILWLICLCASGILQLIYYNRSGDYSIIDLDLSAEFTFSIIPLLITFVHPFLLIWSNTIVYTWFQFRSPIIPVVNQHQPNSTDQLSFRTSTASDYADLQFDVIPSMIDN